MASNSTIELNQLLLLPGQSVLQNISWSKFEEIISELGNIAPLNLHAGMLEIMVPLPEHEYFKDAIGDLVKDLAEELAMNTNVSVLPLGGDKSAWEVQNLITAFTSRIYGRFVEDWTLTWPLTLPRFGIEIDITSKSIACCVSIGCPEAYDRSNCGSTNWSTECILRQKPVSLVEFR